MNIDFHTPMYYTVEQPGKQLALALGDREKEIIEELFGKFPVKVPVTRMDELWALHVGTKQMVWRAIHDALVEHDEIVLRIGERGKG